MIATIPPIGDTQVPLGAASEALDRLDSLLAMLSTYALDGIDKTNGSGADTLHHIEMGLRMARDLVDELRD